MSTDHNPLPARFELPQGEVRLPASPPEIEYRDPGWIVSAIPVMGIAVMAIFYVLRAITEPANSALFAIPLLLLAGFTVLGTVLSQRWRRGDHQRQRDEQTLKYVRALHAQRVRLQAARDSQSATLQHFFPAARKHLHLLLDGRQSLPLRHPEAADFGLVRVGSGRVPLSVRIVTSESDGSTDNTLSLQLADEYRYLAQSPLTLSLLTDAPLGMEGRRPRTAGVARAMLAGLFMSHLPDALQVVVFAAQSPREEWAWLRWLPHSKNGQWLALDADAARRVGGQLNQLLDARQQSGAAHLPQLLVIFDGMPLEGNRALYDAILRDGREVGIAAMCICARREDLPPDCRTVLALEDDDTLHYAGARDNDLAAGTAHAERLSVSDAEAAARAVARVMEADEEQGGQIPRHIEFLDLYELDTVEQIQRLIHARWNREAPDGVLPFPVPIGRESLAETLWLWLDEEHHGPHGMLAGTTGSGKSELLQTLICALAVEHHPQALNLLLIDFKGGSTFNVFRDLPHTVGMVTNLDGALIERVLEALKSETEERQRYFKQVNVRDITQYQRLLLRPARGLRPMPHLFVIVDEFAQLAREMPDFLSELVRTAQVGRSLGLHLILGTQSPRDVITDEMNANLQFRICLRVQNVEASRAMLRRPDAAYLPSGWAGRGFLQVGERDLFRQFQTAFSGGDYRAGGGDSRLPVLELIADSGQPLSLVAESGRRSGSDEAPESTARAIVRMIVDYAARHDMQAAPALLLPPLEPRIALGDVWERSGADGWNGREWSDAHVDSSGEVVRTGSAPIGLLDDVVARQQLPLWIHLNVQPNRIAEKDGHLLIVGGPGSGKTNALRTLALSLARYHHPDALHLYLMSFTGGGLNDIGARLPHAGRVVAGTEAERVRRLFRRLIHTLEQRQTGQQAAHPTIVLMIDQYEQLRDTYYEQHLTDFERLISEGRSAGIFVVVTANSISALPDRTRSLIHQRIALRMADNADYLLTVGAYTAQTDQPLLPGRGYVYHTPPLPCQICLPALHLTLDEDALRQESLALMTEMSQSYRRSAGKAQAPEPIGELPARIVLETLPQPEARARLVTPLGISDDDSLSLFQLDWWEQGPHFIVSGSPGSGKTNLLQAAVLQAARQHTPQQVRFVLVDFTGRSLRHLARLKHTLAHVTDQEALVSVLAQLRAEMQLFRQQEQQQGERVTLPRTVLVIDDYDLFSDSLSALPDVMRELRDHVRLNSVLGLHVWAAGYFERIGDPFMRQILMQRCGFALGSRESLYPFNLRTAGLPADVMPAGRAFFVQYNRLQIVQCALVDDALYYVYGCNQNDAAPAQWFATAEEPTFTAAPDNPRLPDITIDTAGLIADLLGDEEADDA